MLPPRQAFLLLLTVGWVTSVRVYNALITSQQELLPSRVYPSWVGPHVYLGHHLHPHHLQPVLYQSGYEVARDPGEQSPGQLLLPHLDKDIPIVEPQRRNYVEQAGFEARDPQQPQDVPEPHTSLQQGRHTQAIARHPQRRPSKEQAGYETRDHQQLQDSLGLQPRHLAKHTQAMARQPQRRPYSEQAYQDPDPQHEPLELHPRQQAKHTQAVARQPQRRPVPQQSGYSNERPARKLMYPDPPIDGLPLNNRPMDIPVVPPPPLPIRRSQP